MYNIHAYGRMTSENLRMNAYVRALRQAVRPESVVLDIGTGTGIFALLACQFGARRVYAIEPDPAIQVAREMAAANGYADRIEFFETISTKVTLPEKADVIISELRGVVPLFQNHLPSIVDARKRLLAPGGTLIPQRDTMWIALVEAPDLYSRYITPWDNNSYGLNMKPAQRYLINSWHKNRVTPEQLLVEPQCWAVLDYTTLECPHVSGEVSWTVARTGTAHGFNLWFDATLAEGIYLSNAPGAPEIPMYSSGFFPWPEPISLIAGDRVSIILYANLVAGDYVWRWETRIFDQGNPEQMKTHFKQSTFFGQPLSPERLAKRGVDHVPVLTKEGQIDGLILDSMRDNHTLSETARQVSAQFPTHFLDEQDVMERVRNMSERYSC